MQLRHALTYLKLILVCEGPAGDVDGQLTLLHPEDQRLACVGHPPTHRLLVHTHCQQVWIIL
jgi:hypothetical protein